jgi:hypothetical protein
MAFPLRSPPTKEGKGLAEFPGLESCYGDDLSQYQRSLAASPVNPDFSQGNPSAIFPNEVTHSIILIPSIVNNLTPFWDWDFAMNTGPFVPRYRSTVGIHSRKSAYLTIRAKELVM